MSILKNKKAVIKIQDSAQNYYNINLLSMMLLSFKKDVYLHPHFQ